jgi:hypothetical protein
VQRVLDQQAAEARAVDEQLAGDARPSSRCTASRSRRPERRSTGDDLAFDPLHATRFAHLAQERAYRPASKWKA